MQLKITKYKMLSLNLELGDFSLCVDGFKSYEEKFCDSLFFMLYEYLQNCNCIDDLGERKEAYRDFAWNVSSFNSEKKHKE
jgi:hypothetical protein